jgi:hypothetical protein
VQQERHHRAIGFGQVQCALRGVPSGGRAAERAAGDRLQHASLSQPGPPVDGNWAVQDRFERRRRGTRVVLRQPQRCRGDAYLAVFAALLAKPGECLLGWLGLAEAH